MWVCSVYVVGGLTFWEGDYKMKGVVGLRDFEFESRITEGKVYKIDKVVFEFNRIVFLFGNLRDGREKRLVIEDVVDLSVEKDAGEAADIMAYETLIGYDFEKEGDFYIHCLKTDTYEMVIKSYGGPELEKSGMGEKKDEVSDRN